MSLLNTLHLDTQNVQSPNKHQQATGTCCRVSYQSHSANSLMFPTDCRLENYLAEMTMKSPATLRHTQNSIPTPQDLAAQLRCISSHGLERHFDQFLLFLPRSVVRKTVQAEGTAPTNPLSISPLQKKYRLGPYGASTLVICFRETAAWSVSVSPPPSALAGGCYLTSTR